MLSTGNNPDWANRPPWALWWAVDADGRAHWHFIMPVIRDGEWVYHEGPGDHNGWNKKQFDQVVTVEDWTQTLCEYAPKPMTPAKPAIVRVEARYWWDDD